MIYSGILYIPRALEFVELYCLSELSPHGYTSIGTSRMLVSPKGSNICAYVGKACAPSACTIEALAAGPLGTFTMRSFHAKIISG